MKYLKSGGTWILTILPAVLMAGPGSQKFTSNVWERMFRQWGYPDGFYLVIGAVEVIDGLALLIPRFASYSAIVLSSRSPPARRRRRARRRRCGYRA